MSAYTEALQRYRSAVAQGKDSAEAAEAARVLQRFAVDPQYKAAQGWMYGDPQSSPASLPAAITEREAA